MRGGSGAHGQLDAWTRAANPHPHIVEAEASLEMLRMLVAADYGVSMAGASERILSSDVVIRPLADRALRSRRT